MRAVDKYLEIAIDTIKDTDSGFWNNGNTKIVKVYKGYIASFGTIIKQSGLLPAVVLFSKESDRGETSKKPIIKAIYKLLKAESGLVDVNKHRNLLEFAKDKKRAHQARKEMIYAAIALKLALRTFKIEK